MYPNTDKTEASTATPCPCEALHQAGWGDGCCNPCPLLASEEAGEMFGPTLVTWWEEIGSWLGTSTEKNWGGKQRMTHCALLQCALTEDKGSPRLDTGRKAGLANACTHNSQGLAAPIRFHTDYSQVSPPAIQPGFGPCSLLRQNILPPQLPLSFLSTAALPVWKPLLDVSHHDPLTF